MLIGFATSLTAWLAGGAAMYWVAARDDDTEFDARLELLAQTVLTFAQHELVERATEPPEQPEQLDAMIVLGERYTYQIWTNTGTLLLRSSNSPSALPLVPLGQTGFRNLTIANQEARVYSTLASSGPVQIQVSERMDRRAHVAAEFGNAFFAFMLTVAALLSFATSVLLRYALRSVEALSSELTRRGPLDLASLPNESPPREMVGMFDSINLLFKRIDDAMCVQRGFIAVAAHELRTPLAGLRAHAQVARRARNDIERRDALLSVMVAVDRTSHLLDQLLNMARVDTLVSEPALIEARFVTVELAPLIDSILFDIDAGHSGKPSAIDVVVQAARIEGVDFGIQMLVSNLLRNAVAYSPPGGQIRIATEHGGESIVITVDDSGPGIPMAERHKVFDRFYRGAGARVAGAGLGLAIVQAVATVHRARVVLSTSPFGGLRVQVHFPGAPAEVGQTLSHPKGSRPISSSIHER